MKKFTVLALGLLFVGFVCVVDAKWLGFSSGNSQTSGPTDWAFINKKTKEKACNFMGELLTVSAKNNMLAIASAKMPKSAMKDGWMVVAPKDVPESYTCGFWKTESANNSSVAAIKSADNSSAAAGANGSGEAPKYEL